MKGSHFCGEQEQAADHGEDPVSDAGLRPGHVEQDGGRGTHRATASRFDSQVNSTPIGRVRMTKPAAMMKKMA